MVSRDHISFRPQKGKPKEKEWWAVANNSGKWLAVRQAKGKRIPEKRARVLTVTSRSSRLSCSPSKGEEQAKYKDHTQLDWVAIIAVAPHTFTPVHR